MYVTRNVIIYYDSVGEGGERYKKAALAYMEMESKRTKAEFILKDWTLLSAGSTGCPQQKEWVRLWYVCVDVYRFSFR